MNKALFVCVENAIRSQIDEGAAKKYGKNNFITSIVDNKPDFIINSVVFEPIKEKGINSLTNKPKVLSLKMVPDPDLVATMSCNHNGKCTEPNNQINNLLKNQRPEKNLLKKQEKPERRLSEKSKRLVEKNE